MAEFDPAQSGVNKELRRLELEFDVGDYTTPAHLLTVNSIAYDPAGAAPQLTLGGTEPVTDDFGTIDPTGPFAPREGEIPPAMQLAIDLSSLSVGVIRDWNCGRPWAAGRTTAFPNNCTRLSRDYLDEDGSLRGNVPDADGLTLVYARNGLVQVPTDGGPFELEAPQYPSILYTLADQEGPAKFFHRYGFNATTRRYETSKGTLEQLAAAHFDAPVPPTTDPNAAIKSDWDLVRENMCNYFGVSLEDWTGTVPTKPTDLDPFAPAGCGEVTFNDDFVAQGIPRLGPESRILFVIDQSGSMDANDVTDANGKPISRLDNAKAAARELFETYAGVEDDTPGPRVGIIYYSDTATQWMPGVDQKICTVANQLSACSSHICEDGYCQESRCTQENAASHCPSGVCLDGFCKKPMPPSGTGTGQVSKQEFYDVTVPKNDAKTSFTERPSPDGQTATGSALELASRIFDVNHPPGETPTNVIFHLTDGLANIPHAGKCIGGHGNLCGSLFDSSCAGICKDARDKELKAIDLLHAQGTLYWEYPIFYDDFGRPMQDAPMPADRRFPGALPNGEDMMPLFFEGYAALRGQKLALSHEHLPDLAPGSYHDTEYDIRVEEGATRLVVAISENDSKHDEFSVDPARLYAPGGALYKFDDSPSSTFRVSTDAFYGLMFVEAPEPGLWSMHQSGASGSPRRPAFFVSAFVDNALPGCEVKTVSVRRTAS
jgi:hypothetical protein